MRLTLRTLLAYADNILDPKDAQEVAQKIEESEFAQGLLKRIHDLKRRLRLAAPDVHQRGPGLDPNTVAEYLDNTLSSERVADFEKVCLESESGIQLAEVASCHQILALVLGEPAEIDAASRQRMYDLVAGMPAADSPPPTDGDQHLDDKSGRAKPMVPDYLREPTDAAPKALLPVAIGVLLSLLLAIVVCGAFGMFEADGFFGRLLWGNKPGPANEMAENRAPPPAPPAIPTTSSTPAAVKNGATPPATSGTASTGWKPAAVPAAATATTVEKGKEELADNRLAAKTPPATMPVVSPPPGSAAANAAQPPAAAGPAATITIKTPGAAAAPPAMPPGKSSTVAQANVKAGGFHPANPFEVALSKPAGAAGQPVPALKSADELPGEAAPLPAEQVGRLTSEKQVLLAYDVGGGWRRVASQEAVSTRVPLLALPSYQPVIALRVPLTVQIFGGTEVEFLPADPQGISGIHVGYGKLVLRAVGTSKTRLRLQFGRHRGLLTFLDGDSTLALNVDNTHTWGSNPERESALQHAEFFGVNGRLLWAEAGNEISIGAPTQVRLGEGLPRTPVALADLPLWISNGDNNTSLDKLDKRAAPRVEQALQVGRTVVLSLRELIDVSQREVAWLAIRSLGYVGDFQPMVAVFNSPEQRAVWDDYLAQLQVAMARGPDVAAKIRQAFEKQYGKNAPLLYRMLWGYSEADIKSPSGAGVTLVEYLDHEMLAFRVLAFYNLERLSKVRYGYRPYDPPGKRQAAVVRWRNLLSNGLLAPKPGDREKKAAPSDLLR